MRPLKTIFARATVVEVMLALSILTGCSGDPTSPGPIVGPPSTVDVVYCTGVQPTWVAFQDGDGAWTQALPAIVGDKITFRHSFTADRGGIAAVRTVSSGLTTLSVQYGLPAELAFVGDTNPSHCGLVVSKTLLGTVAGLGTNDFAAVNAGFGSRDIVAPFGTGSNSYSLGALTTGPQDILATRSTLVANGTNVLTRVILRRTPELPDSATLPVLDFDSAEAFAPAVANVTIRGLGAEGATAVTRLRTAHGESEISFLTNSESAATRTFYAIPEARLEARDLHVLIATANPTPGHPLSAAVYFHSPVDQTLTLGAPVAAPALSTVATTPSLRLRARFDNQQDYDRITSISYQQGQNRLVSVGMTAAYAALGLAGYDLTVPDLSAVAGFDTRWPLRADAPVFWIASRMGGTLGLGFNAVPTNGATVRTGITFDSLVP